MTPPPEPAPVYHVTLVRPPGYAHAEALREVAETLHHGIAACGLPVSFGDHELAGDATNIVLGAHLLQPAEHAALPDGTILYNFEQLGEESWAASPAYLQALRERCTWDYSRRNIEQLRARDPAGEYHHVPLGYVPALSRIPAAEHQDIDVLFYGSLNDRRRSVLRGLEDAGAKVSAVFGVYGAERDALIARSKLVLNLHYYSTSVFEVVRASYLLANRKAVVAECSAETEIEPHLRDAVELATFEELVPTCLALLGDDVRRRRLEERGFARIAAHSEASILARTLGVADG